MKRSQKGILVLQVIMIIALWFNTVNNVLSNNIIYSIYLFLILVTSYFILGFEGEEKLNGLEVLRIVFVYSIIYLVIIYILGIFIGFTNNPYNIDKLLNNITIPLIIIVFEELIRYNIIKKGSKISIAVIMTIIFIVGEVFINIKLYPLTTPMEIFNVICLLIIPVITRNLLMSYIAYKGYYKVNILYRFIFELNTFVLPIYPNTGVYLEAIASVVLPSFIYFKIYNIYVKKSSNTKLVNKKEKAFLIFSIIILALSIILVSGKTNYYAMAVGSGSMEPEIKVADAVIVKKTLELKMGDVLVHKHSGKIVLHKIIKIEKVLGEYCYNTKGIANESPDNYQTCEEQIIGKVIFRIPYIGWPSVLLERIFSKR